MFSSTTVCHTSLHRILPTHVCACASVCLTDCNQFCSYVNLSICPIRYLFAFHHPHYTLPLSPLTLCICIYAWYVLLGKRNVQSSRASAFDSVQASIHVGDTVNVVTGTHIKKSGTIKHIMKGLCV